MGFFDGIIDTVKDVVGTVSNYSLPNWAGPAATVLGNLWTNSTNRDIADANNAASMKMASTRYQTAVADLKAAGLNPMLAYSQGGAPVAPLQQATVSNPANNQFSNSVAAATVDKIKADTATAISQAQLNEANARKAEAEIQQSVASALNLNAQTDYTKQNMALIAPTIQKVISESNLNFTSMNLVLKNIDNAVRTGSKLEAETGNVQADTALKKIQADLAQQRKYMNELDFPRLQNEYNFQLTPYAQNVAPFVNSAKGGSITSEFMGNLRSTLNTIDQLLRK